MIGPLPSSAALAWTEHGRKVLEEIPGRDDVPFELPPDAIRKLRTLLDEWMWIADGMGTFEWSGEMDDIELRALVRYWMNIAKYLADGGCYGGLELPADAERFETALLAGVVDALGDDFGTRLRAIWPC